MTKAIAELALNVQDLVIKRQDNAHHFTVTLPRLELAKGQILALTGQSGSGKSTLLEVLGLILKPNQLAKYELALRGQSLCDLSQLMLTQVESELAKIRTQALGFVLQNGGLLPFLTVAENIQLTRLHKGLTAEVSWIDEVMTLLKIKHLRHKKPHQLSIGERQRVAFVRALAHEPAVILADEPTAALDPYTAETLFGIMRELTHSLNLSILVVSHDWRLIDNHGITRIEGRAIDEHQSLFEYV